ATALDGYLFGPDFERAARRSGRVVLALDDHAEIGTEHVSDLLLDQNLDASAAEYPDRAAWTEVLAGARYALLRREFVGVSPRRATTLPSRPRVLVSLGGADTIGATPAIVAALRDRPIDLMVVI